ncbi:hypothetical protein [Methylobacterium oxalidis]|uniref:Chemotaxis protein CheZ n=1 Tax=Methylobacterium oxalidis TaxID=944322 RepID=A0A512IWU3_9HYPH|nr:hypothetical protein [Methylobacterium oxalidis]GEP02190.1 hypothetical protein MOX02_02280 [Methylobacterium oxalidis]GJE32181.1 hypothetical protein LDDCCGHA_2364 [Methylobacterium oxalidis]GLS62135.1 hypothetical protein GCM10007888_05160 [Methylobacterium oxalidis]
MSGSQSLSTIEPSEYDLIEATMSESARGRWFLSEYARRNRSADTDMLLGAIGRLESAVTGERGLDGVGRLRGDLMEMASAIARTKAEIAAISAPDQDQTHLSVASEALDAIVRATERATSDILGAAEEVQEAAWTLRERGADAAICDELDRRATQIYTACSFQDLTAQRTSRIVHTLRYLEERLIAMIGIWGDDGLEIPPAPGAQGHRPAIESAAVDLCQSDVDRFIDMAGADPVEAQRAPVPAAIPLHEDLAFLPSEEPAAPVGEGWDRDGSATDLEFGPAESEAAEPALVQALADLQAGSVLRESTDLQENTDADEGPEAEPQFDLRPPLALVAAAPAHAPSSAEPDAEDVFAFDDIDALSIEAKLRLFS